MTDKEPKKNIYQRILGVMADVEYIQKLDKKVNNQYRFVSHDQVTGKLHPSLVKHGIVVIPNTKSRISDGNKTTVCLEVSFVNADLPNDLIKIEMWGDGIDQGDKGYGKAVSYAFKYALLKMFCLETGDDPDNDATAVHVPGEKMEPIASYSIEDFTKMLSGFSGVKLDSSDVAAYLASIASPQWPINKIMKEAALLPSETHRFITSFKSWAEERE